MPDLSLGRQIARSRRRLGLSQQQLADRLCAATGGSTISRNEISRWERGARLPSGPWLTLLSTILGTQLSAPPPPKGTETVAAARWATIRRQISTPAP
jgi:transcriptional regulator with XRE-family HTH domain